MTGTASAICSIARRPRGLRLANLLENGRDGGNEADRQREGEARLLDVQPEAGQRRQAPFDDGDHVRGPRRQGHETGREDQRAKAQDEKRASSSEASQSCARKRIARIQTPAAAGRGRGRPAGAPGGSRRGRRAGDGPRARARAVAKRRVPRPEQAAKSLAPAARDAAGSTPDDKARRSSDDPQIGRNRRVRRAVEGEPTLLEDQDAVEAGQRSRGRG